MGSKKAQPEEKLDRRVIRTRRAIMDAYNVLLATKDVGKITVSALAREADIDRKTFYLHYSSIDALIDAKTEEFVAQVLNAAKDQVGADSERSLVHAVLSEVNTVLEKDLLSYQNIAKHLSVDSILDHFHRMSPAAFERAGMEPSFVNDPEARLNMRFLVGGAISAYSWWLRSDRSLPIEAVSAVIESSITLDNLTES